MLCFETCQQLLVYFHWCYRRVSTVVSATLIYFFIFSLFLELDLFIVNIYFFVCFAKIIIFHNHWQDYLTTFLTTFLTTICISLR